MIILAYKQQGIVYLATDTRLIFGHRKESRANEPSSKLRVLDNGVIVGIATHNYEWRKAVLDHPELFTLTKGGDLTHRHIVTKIIPALFDLSKEGDHLQKDSDCALMDGDLVLAYRDKLFYINAEFWTVECERWINAGTYAFGVGHLAHIDESRDIEEQLIAALKASERYSTWIGGPFVTVNTRDLVYQVKEVD